MSDYTIDWSHTNIDGNNSVSGSDGNIGFTVSTPENVNHDQWMQGTVSGVDGLKAWDVCNPTKVTVDFDEPVQNVTFDLIDVDSDQHFDDRVTIIAKDAHGNILPVTFSGLNSMQSANNGTLNATGHNISQGDAGNVVHVSIHGEVASLEVILNNGAGANISGTVGIGDISFDAVAPEGDGYVEGGNGDDVINVAYAGDPDGDRIDNNDALLPGEAAQDDVVLAGAGDDFVLAGDGNDEVYGGDGDDTLCGNDGDDVLYGGAGNDILEGMNNNDVLLGAQGADTLYGDAGQDVMSGGVGNDAIFGGSGSDVASGGKGDDTIIMGNGHDLAYGGGGADSISGGAGNDTLIGGSMGFDGTQNFNDLSTGELVDGQYIAEGVTITSADPRTPVMAFDTANPTGGDDDLATNNLGKVLILSEDRDSSDPDDNASGGTFNITFENPATVTSLTLLDADGGAQVRYFDADGNVLQQVNVTTANNGQEVISTNLSMVASIQVTLGASGAIDNLSYSIDPDVMDGNDVISGGDGDDDIFGNAGDDTLAGDAGSDNLFGGDGSDTLIAGAGDVVDGGAGGADNDILDLTGQGAFTLQDVVEDSNGNGIDGTVVFVDDDGNPTGETLTFTEIEQILGTQVNLAPDAQNDTATVDEDGEVTIDVLGNDSDPDGDPLTVTEATSPDGTVTINPDGTITFTPNDDFNGDTTITYTITDPSGNEDTATVSVTVNPVNDGPVAVEDTDATDQDTAIVLDNVLGNDSDPDGDPLTVSEINGDDSLVGTPVEADNGGLITINADGSTTFDPNGQFDDLAVGETAETTVSYTITDPDGGTDTTTVTVTVTGTNDAPVANTQTESTDEDTPITVDLLANDSDVDGDDLTVVSATLVSGEGTIVDNGDGTVTFTPAPNFNGEAVIEYTIEDEEGLQASSTHVITVEGVEDAPEAVDDVAETDEDTPVTIDVLGNDSDPDGDPLTVTEATSPDGTVTINPDGTITFTPNDDFNGDTTITYTVTDPDGNEATATVDVTVNPVNDAPDAVDDADVTDFNTPVTVDLLDNDTDVDGDDLTVISAQVPAAQGTLVDNGDGTVRFTPAAGFTGVATITYVIEDEEGLTDTAIHTITVLDGVLDGTVEGTDGDDIIDGGYMGDPDGDMVDNDDAILPGDVEDDDLIFGFDGDDTIRAGAGDDEVFGGTGDDSIAGQGGNDTLSGDEGDDIIIGGQDNDTIFGGDDNDILDGDSGDDSIEGGDGDDSILGGGGEDVIGGGSGDDTIDGENNDDMIFGGLGDDTIDGGSGDDKVEGGSGDDSITGGAGDDDLWGASGDDTIDGGTGDDTITSGDGNDVIEGGEGDDTIDTSGHAPLPDLSFGDLIPADGGTFTLPDGTVVVTSPDDDLDTVFGGAGNDTITTGDDADFIDGGMGDDVIDGGIDADEIIGGDGDDTIIGGEGSDSISGGEGDDTIFAGIEPGGSVIPGGPFIPEQIDDDLGDPEPDNGDDLVFGGAGNDTIFGADDSDVLYGDEGDDVINGEIDDDTLFGGDGNDTLDGGANDDTIEGGIGDDVIIGGTGVDDLDGGLGNDTFLGGNGGDVVVGGEDPDADGDGESDDIDVLDLTGSNVDFITYDETDPTFANGVGESGTVTFQDGSTMTFSEIENVIPCFTPGTTIATPKGERLVEELREGDRIITRDNGIQEIRWVGRKEMSGKALVANPHLKPILVRAGSLGNGLPERDMLVSPNHRMLVASEKTQLYFEEREVLAAAKHLIGSEGIHAVDVMGTAYIHFMFDRHEVVLSNGAWTESFQPGDYSLKGIGNSQRNEIFELFPELQSKTGLEGYQSARRALKKHEARLLVK